MFADLYAQLQAVIPSFILDLFVNHMVFRLVLINVICFILTLGGHILVNQLGCSFETALGHLQIYRFLTSMFVHDGISHLLCNMTSLIVNGWIVEKNFGQEMFLFYYFASGILGGIVSCLIHKILGDNCISVGASGAICGLMGVTVMNTLLGFGLTGNLLYVLVAVIPIIIIGFSAGVDNICHFTSFFAGAILCFFFR